MQRLKNSDGGSSSKTSIRISTPKSDSSLRIIPLSDYLIDICNQWTWMAPEAYVLTGDLDRFVEPRTLQYRLQSIPRNVILKMFIIMFFAIHSLLDV